MPTDPKDTSPTGTPNLPDICQEGDNCPQGGASPDARPDVPQGTYRAFSPSVDLVLEALPGSAPFEHLLQVASGGRRVTVVQAFAMPDFRSLCNDMKISVCDLAEILGVPVPVAVAVWNGWHHVTMSEALHVCQLLEIPLGLLFHDANRNVRPMTADWDNFQMEREL